MASRVRHRAVFDRSSDNLRGGGPNLFPSIVPEPTHDGRSGHRHFPEIDCVRSLLPDDVILAAERRAAKIGVSADRVLITAGTLSEESYLRRLAVTLDVRFETFGGIEREQCPLGDERLLEAAAAGLLPLTADDDLKLVIAPRGAAIRRIIQLIGDKPDLAQRFRFTTEEKLRGFISRHTDIIGERAAQSLHKTWPELSAAPPRWRANKGPASAGVLAMLALFILPAQTALAFEIMLTVVFLGWMGLRLIGALIDWRHAASFPLGLRDDELPIYTIVSALYREASSVDGLLAAIERLDYPPEKLDVKIVIEADDDDTRAALDARHCSVPIEVIVAPPASPRTKPKALNAALPLARGAFIVIYDAEDRPEPDQLRSALQAFTTADDDLACVQARLSIDNTKDGWLARFFTAEYAGQFDVFLPGIAALGLPLPLGGSSNHFRSTTLRAIGGWDPYNVTEDADLGMRLARFGYRASMIDSTTYEEAPARFGPWLRQRTRWFKGWMQTWMVHMRAPRGLLRDLGLPGFLAFQLMVGGNVLAALVHPLFMGTMIYSIVSGAPMWKGDGVVVSVLAALYGLTVVIGYFTSGFLGWFGLMRRGLLATSWVLLLTPVHWLMLSLAAWRAVYQLIAEPYRWEKTEHGLATSSRLAARATHSLSRLERYLSGFDLATLVPQPTGGLRDISAARRQSRRAAA